MKSTGKTIKADWVAELQVAVNKAEDKPKGWLTSVEIADKLKISESRSCAILRKLRHDSPELATRWANGRSNSWAYDWPKISKMIGWDGE